MPNRKFLPHELNHLRKYDFDLEDLDSIGEMPVEYVTGHAQFAGNDFLVTKDTLIPRLETEETIGIAMGFIASLPPHHLNIADIGTGSGCIGISLAKKLIDNGLNDFEIYLSDISPEALKVAEQNSKAILPKIQNQFHYINSNLLEGFENDTIFDLVISNLPYIPGERIANLDSSVKDFEPLSALDGGKQGTDLINKLLLDIPKHLQPNFQVILEIDDTHTLNMFSTPPRSHGTIKKDTLGNTRFLILTPPSP